VLWCYKPQDIWKKNHVSRKVQEIVVTSEIRKVQQYDTLIAVLNKPSLSLLFEDPSARVVLCL
jgi:hypothetical protein